MINNSISDSEEDLMKIIWNSKDEQGNYTAISTNEIMEHVKDRWTVSAVFTFLSRLEKKAYITSSKVGRSNVYTALVKEEDYKLRESKRFINKLYNGSIKSMFAALCDHEVSEKEIEEIESYLKERKEKQKK